MQQAGTSTARILGHATTDLQVGAVEGITGIIITGIIQAAEGITTAEETATTIIEILKKDIDQIIFNSLNPGYLSETSGFFILYQQQIAF